MDTNQDFILESSDDENTNDIIILNRDCMTKLIKMKDNSVDLSLIHI